MISIHRALISVSDKTGLIELAKHLSKYQVEILSTGGTANLLRQNGFEVTDVSTFTGFPEILDGRVKTLHPRIYGGLLALRDNPEHQEQMKKNNLVPIDLVVGNLYPFEATLARGATHEEIIENIDIGGPCMIRAAAKNYRYVVVLVNPGLYPELMKEMEKNYGGVSEDFSFRCAREVYRLTSHYDSAILNYFEKKDIQEKLPDRLELRLEKFRAVRYGENPHQKAVFYRQAGQLPYGLSAAEVLQGKELSFNNYLDLEAVLSGVREFDQPTAYIVKHLSPCGVASHQKLAQAYRLALECDPLSAFGGIVGFNREVDGETAVVILEGMEKHGFLECLLAPGFTPEAREKLAAKKNLRLVVVKDLSATDPIDIKRVTGGWLGQEPDTAELKEWKVVTEREPNEEEKRSLLFAWKVCKTTRSNAIVYARGTATVGIGGGLYSRVDANRLAAAKAGSRAKGAVMASDAFFPQPDNIEVAANAGITAIIQPGGSIKDQECITACNRSRIAMVFTGMRHFRH
ncbi:MAG: bifunctional phosphoribosylaminoimidazolecarboxamide formyltransferase/IMP cyclohydrolase [Candidatus Omnitrophica bacterium]|nr:bifunctional phosphoribosylaminoimidazolecarboxamide formyltransferase/IMP cyclohydrolase [Candidatus Omnitrophota bacterium]